MAPDPRPSCTTSPVGRPFDRSPRASMPSSRDSGGIHSSARPDSREVGSGSFPMGITATEEGPASAGRRGRLDCGGAGTKNREKRW